MTILSGTDIEGPDRPDEESVDEDLELVVNATTDTKDETDVGDDTPADVDVADDALDGDKPETSESMVNSEADADVEAAADVGVDAKTDTKIDTDLDTDAEVDAEAETDTKIDTDADAKTDAEATDIVEVTTGEVDPDQSPAPEPSDDDRPAAAKNDATRAESETSAHADSSVEATKTDPDLWTFRQILSVAQRILAAVVAMAILGYALGSIRGGQSIARSEFVYTLDESVPDSFLREDRRLLTQVVTFKSDAVLTPVAAEFDLTVDELRSKIDVETVNLSEVLRFDVQDVDSEVALQLNRAVVEQYLTVTLAASPAGDGTELSERRAEVSEQLAAADETRMTLEQTRRDDIELEAKEQSITRRVNQRSEQVDRLQQELDNALTATSSAASRSALSTQLAEAQQGLDEEEAELAVVRTQRAELAAATTAEPALLREIARLESMMATIDAELAERQLGPLVASPIRELSQPIMLETSRRANGIQGMALGTMASIPLAAYLAYRTRRRQLWNG